MCIPIIFSVLSLVLYSGTVNAASVVGSASLTVQNSVSVNQTQAIDFGNLTINRSSSYLLDNNSTLRLSPQGKLTSTGSAFIPSKNSPHEIAYLGSPAMFSVTNTAPYIDLTLDISQYSQLVHTSGYEQNGKLHLSNLTASSTKNTHLQYVSGDIITTDMTGKIELAFGASITIDSDKDYDDGLYTGTYSIALHY